MRSGRAAVVEAASRAGIRRLVALEGDHGDLRDRLERRQLRLQELPNERDAALQTLNDCVREAAAQPLRGRRRASRGGHRLLESGILGRMGLAPG